MRCLFAFTIIAFILLEYECQHDKNRVQQEAAKVMYANPKYIKSINIFTYRATRKSPYLTSCNATIFEPWENNVSLVVDCRNPRLNIEIFSLEFKVCDILKVTWAKDWVKTYTNIPLHCPILPMMFRFTDIEIPPKNFPISLPDGDYTARLVFQMTKTKEKILELKMNLKFQTKKF